MLPTLRLGVLGFLLGVFYPTSLLRAQAAPGDSSAVTSVVTRFHDALTAGDSMRAVAQLASNAVVLESGAIETRAEYLSHHLGADMEASKNSKGTRGVVHVRVLGDAAYVVSRTVTPPTGEEGSTGSQMVELMVLERTTAGWKIQAIHWSSRRRRVTRAGDSSIRGAARHRAARAGTLVVALLAGSTTLLTAHDFWLVPDAFAVTPGGRIELRGQTSSLFPSSLSAVTPDRIVSARVVNANSAVTVGDVSVQGQSLRLAHATTTAGQHLIGVQLAPRSVRESPASFRRYLDLEGAPEARQRYEREGLLPPLGGDSIVRRYAKYAKTVVEVGDGPRAFQRLLNHPLEFVPLSDPSALRVGDTLRVKLVLLGKSAVSAYLHAGYVPSGPRARTDTAAARRAAARDVKLVTDASGVATVVITQPGLWNIRTLQIVPADKDSGADWDVHWATMVFAVARR